MKHIRTTTRSKHNNGTTKRIITIRKIKIIRMGNENNHKNRMKTTHNKKHKKTIRILNNTTNQIQRRIIQNITILRILRHVIKRNRRRTHLTRIIHNNNEHKKTHNIIIQRSRTSINTIQQT